MKKLIIFAGTFALLVGTGVAFFVTKQNARLEASSLLLQNLEAVARGEKTAKCSVECNGWFGWCTYDCENCGAKLSALGDALNVNDSCSSNN